MNLGPDNKVVVGGGARGLGTSIVAALAGQGAVPFILDRQAPSKELLARTGAPGQAIDLGDPLACEEAIGRIAARFGRIDGLVNVAGEETGPFTEGPLLASITVAFLLSARAGLTIGQWLYLDGGYVRREPGRLTPG